MSNKIINKIIKKIDNIEKLHDKESMYCEEVKDLLEDLKDPEDDIEEDFEEEEEEDIDEEDE
jgi:hypothetical protein